MFVLEKRVDWVLALMELASQLVETDDKVGKKKNKNPKTWCNVKSMGPEARLTGPRLTVWPRTD